MHALHELIKKVEKTHKGLGRLIAMNILAAKALKCILNIAPAGCGKSTATECVYSALRNISRKYTSLTLAGLKHIAEELSNYRGHIIIDDLGAEKSTWARVSTITVIANLVHTGYVYKITQTYIISIENFQGSAAINIQPVLLNSLVGDEDWIAVVRDKTLRFYHLHRPRIPQDKPPHIEISWGKGLDEVQLKLKRGKLWYQLIAYGLVQWSYARCLEHLPAYLKAAAALDGRTKVEQQDYRLLIKLLKPMVMERYLMKSYGLEAGIIFEDDVYCLMTELATNPAVPIQTICDDYKVSPKTVERIVQEHPEYFWIKQDSEKMLMPTEHAKQILAAAGAYDKW
jgi:hypothetical protein